MNVVVRTSADPRQLAQILPQEVCDWTLRNLLAVSSAWINCCAVLATDRFAMWLLGLLCGTRLAAGWTGIYGVLAFAVASERTRSGSAGVGAQARDVLRLVLAQGMKLACAGVLLGLGGAWR